MTHLTDPLADDARTLVDLAAGTFFDRRVWPIWQHVKIRLHHEGLDAPDILAAMPTWGRYYRSVRVEDPQGGYRDEPLPGERIGLTLHGLIHCSDDRAQGYVRAVLEAMSHARSAQLAVEPDPDRVVPIQLEARHLVKRIEHHFEFTGKELFDALNREPPAWSGLSATGGGSPHDWTWDLTRLQLGGRAIGNPRAYLRFLEAEHVGLPEESQVLPVLPAMALPEALDHLDLAWRLVNGKAPLVYVTRAALAAELSQPADSKDEFHARCNSLTNVLGALKVPAHKSLTDDRDRPLQRLRCYFQDQASESGQLAVEAVETLMKVNALRNFSLHQVGSTAIRGDVVYAELGLKRFGSDWGAAWDQVRGLTVGALATIRETLVETLPVS